MLPQHEKITFFYPFDKVSFGVIDIKWLVVFAGSSGDLRDM